MQQQHAHLMKGLQPHTLEPLPDLSRLRSVCRSTAAPAQACRAFMRLRALCRSASLTFALDVRPECAVATSTSMPLSSASMRPHAPFLQDISHAAGQQGFAQGAQVTGQLVYGAAPCAPQASTSWLGCVSVPTPAPASAPCVPAEAYVPAGAHLHSTFSTSVASACTSGLSLRTSSSS